MKIKLIGSVLTLLLIFSSSSAIFAQDGSQTILTEVAAHLARRDYTSALELFNKLPKEEAEKIEIRIMQASIYNSAGKTADAKRIANAIIASDSNNTDALMTLADAAAIEGKDKERRGFLDRIIKIDANHVRALIDLGNINLRNQNLRSAATYFDRALAADSENGEALVSRATVYRYTREARNAERLLNRAVSLYPDWARPLHERARLYKGAGYNNDALKDLTAAINLEPDNYWMLVDRGELYMEVNRKEDALSDFNRAIKSEPNIFMAYVYSAALKDEAGDYAGAEKDYTTLAKLKPDYYFAFEALGALRMRNKQWALARDAFLEAYKQAPKEFTYALLAAANWMRAGRQTDPKQFLAQVLRTAPRDSIEYSMLRLYHDLSGDSGVTISVESEKNVYKKSQMLFYLATFYDIRGNKNLADRYYLMAQDLNAPGTIEWQLNEMILLERNLGVRAGK
ncbi:MAG: tetratricopeptide repeat protein [Treponema sp.]|nr:tetratricopeptide repeat protein [Treponema sp.]